MDARMSPDAVRGEGRGGRRGWGTVAGTGLLAAATLFLTPPGSGSLVAQVRQGDITLGSSFVLSSGVLGEDREVRVFTPPGYDSGDEAYPVLYVLDGEFTFHFSTGIADFLDKTNRIPPLIVVGVVNVDRTRDYTPQPGEAERSRYATAGGADRFLRFMEEELIPFVDGEFRTRPYRVLFGHSHGGLFTARAFLESAAFQAFIASSPSLFWNGQSQVALLEERLATLDRGETSLFLTMGSERQEMMDGVEAFTQVLGQGAPDWLTWRYHHLEGKDHEEMPFPSLFEGLEFTFWDYRDPELLSALGFEDFRAWQREKYGYEPDLPVGFLFAGFSSAQRRSCEDMLGLLTYWREHHERLFLNFADDWMAEAAARLDAGEPQCAAGVYRAVLAADPDRLDAQKGLEDALAAAGGVGETEAGSVVLTVPSSILGGDRRVTVVLPEGYRGASDRYPVVYATHVDAAHLAGTVADLSGDLMPPAIMVHVVTEDSGNLLPTPVAGRPGSGGAEKLARFYAEELVPAIDARFRTAPFRVFHSASWGGVFCVHTLLTQPALFQACVAATPWVIYDGAEGYLLKAVGDVARGAAFGHNALFIALGNDDDPGLRQGVEALVDTLRHAGLEGLSVEYRYLPEEDHYSIGHRASYDGLRWIFRDWAHVPTDVVDGGPRAATDYLDDMTRRFGYPVGAHWGSAYARGLELLSSGAVEGARTALAVCTRLGPAVPHCQEGVGRVEEAEGNVEGAHTAYQRALLMARQAGYSDLGRFEDAVARTGLGG